NSPKDGSLISGSGSAACAISRGSASRSASSIAPAFLADQRDEANTAEILPQSLAAWPFRDLDQLLHRAGIAERHHQAAALGELLEQSFWNMASARSGEDRIIRRIGGPAPGTVALDDLDIVVTEGPHAVARDGNQLGLALDRD